MAAHERDHLKLASQDPLSDASVALEDIQALLAAILALTRERLGSEDEKTEPVVTLAMIAQEQCSWAKRCLYQMVDELAPPRAPAGQEGSPCQDREAPVPSAPRIRAAGVDLVDHAGRVRASLDLALNEEPGLRLFDRTGDELAAFCLDEEGYPTLFFSDGSGVRLCLDLHEDEGSPGSPLQASMWLTAADRFERFALDVNADGTPSLVISDAARREVWRAPAQASTRGKEG